MNKTHKHIDNVIIVIKLTTRTQRGMSNSPNFGKFENS